MPSRRRAGDEAESNDRSVLHRPCLGPFRARCRLAFQRAALKPVSLQRDRARFASLCYRELRDKRHFPGMQPVGRVPNSHHREERANDVAGVVDSASDGQLAEVRAREVTGVFEVENSLTVVWGRSALRFIDEHVRTCAR